MDWAAVFRVLSHEMRSPTAVISGYARMLQEGRLDEADRAKAIEQIQRATTLLGQLSRQASDLALWIARPPAPASGMTLGSLVEHAITRVAAPAAVTANLAPASAGREVACLDQVALSSAIAGLIDAAKREAGSASVAVIALDTPPAGQADPLVIIGACSEDDARQIVSRPAARQPLSIERGGLGLTLALAAAILDAHDMPVWQLRERPVLLGFTLPAAR